MNDLNSSSGEPEWQKVVDAENSYIERLLGGGFRKEGHGCNSCEAAMINGVYSHEHGCPNTGMIKVDGEWVNPDQDDGLDAEFERIDRRDQYPWPTSESKASKIVAAMLEDYAGDSEERPGGTRDLGRKGGFKKHGLGAKDFLGKRPGQTDKDVAGFSQEEKNPSPGGKMVNPGLERELHKKRRFNWKPPES